MLDEIATDQSKTSSTSMTFVRRILRRLKGSLATLIEVAIFLFLTSVITAAVLAFMLNVIMKEIRHGYYKSSGQ